MSEHDELRKTFIEEARDIGQRILDDIDGFAAASNKEERFNAILRGIHTVKGGAASCGIVKLKEEAHALEAEMLEFKGRTEMIGDAQLQRILRSLDKFDVFLTEATTAPAPASASEGGDGFVLFDEPPKQAQAAPAPEAQGKVKAAATELIRVPIDRIQKNFDAIGEIFLTRNQLRHLVEQRQAGAVQDDAFFRQFEILDNRLRQNIRDLEHNAMAMRLTSVKALLRRMEKTVRTYTEEFGKSIKVELVGEDIELDKLIVDSLAEPLVHLVRNAMDHGVETPDERRAKGKQATAVIRLEVTTSGNEAFVKVGDDGRGIDPLRVLESAKKKGLDVDGVRTRDEMLNLIFLPGFSTKEAVSEVSGRGIGMDAVKTCIEGLGGSTSIETEAGLGTTFTLKLPLGLSVVPAIVALVNGRKIAISTADVLETVKVPRTDIVKNGMETYFKRKGEFIPCIDLEEHVFRAQRPKRRLSRGPMASLCIAEGPHGLVAMQVEELVSNVEIALKAVPAKGATLAYVTGVSILATGEAVFVVSLGRIYERTRTLKGGASGAAA